MSQYGISADSRKDSYLNPQNDNLESCKKHPLSPCAAMGRPEVHSIFQSQAARGDIRMVLDFESCFKPPKSCLILCRQVPITQSQTPYLHKATGRPTFSKEKKNGCLRKRNPAWKWVGATSSLLPNQIKEHPWPSIDTTQSSIIPRGRQIYEKHFISSHQLSEPNSEKPA